MAGGKIASVAVNGLEAEAMRWFYYAYDGDAGYGAPASPGCLLTISNVCLNHAVFIGPDKYTPVSFTFSNGERRDVKGLVRRLKLDSPSVSYAPFMDFPLSFPSCFAPLSY